MMSRRNQAFLAVALFVTPLAGCLERGPGDGPPATIDTSTGQETWRVLAEGWASRVTERSSATATSEAQWAALWANHSASEPPEPRPEVDFATERVLAVFAGSKPHPGWRINLTNVHTDGAARTTVVNVAIVSPPPDQFFPSVIANPFLFVAIPMRDTGVEVAWSEAESEGDYASFSGPETWRVIESGPGSRFTKQGFVVIETPADWRDFWVNHSTSLPPGDPPDVDFARERVLALFGGERSHTGWSVNLSALDTYAENSSTIAHASVNLAPGDGFGQAMTQPYLFVAFADRATRVDVRWADGV